MKYINFKRNKFSTIFKNLNLRRYTLSGVYKFFSIYKYNLPKINKLFDIRKFYISKVFKFKDIKKYNFLKISKNFISKRYKYISLYYGLAFIILSFFIYVSIPIFFSFDKSKVENLLCKNFKTKCFINGKVYYTFFPSPRLKINNFLIQDGTNKKKTFGKINNMEIKISMYNLQNKKKIKYKKIIIDSGEINFNLEKINNYNNFSFESIKIPIKLKNGKINFFNALENIATIGDVNFKYSPSNNKDKAVLKGKILGDNLHVSIENKKKEKKSSKTIILKLLNYKLYGKLSFSNSIANKNIVDGNLLLKQNKKRMTAIFDYKDNKITVKNSNLRNSFTDGKIMGTIVFLPYFDFNLNLDLKGINLYKLYNFLSNLTEEERINLFKFNEKINGKLNLSANKVYSKHDLINSFESRLRFINGNILVDQLLISLGKLGAADMTGIIKNEKKFSTLKFENNIFIDDLKRFSSKFGIFNRKNIPLNLFILGNVDLVNLNMRLEEISGDETLKKENLTFVENEFNNIVLENGYESLFDFLRFKEFVKSINDENN